MVIIELNQVKKYYGERLILEIPTLKIMEKEKVGIVGRNGSGKTTLLNIIAGKVQTDAGSVLIKREFSYIEQLESVKNKTKKLSGGETTKERIRKKLNLKQKILLVDEPTNHLDENNILEVEKKLFSYSGTLLLISHDRKLLDSVCTSIIEISEGQIKKYKGNYSQYQKQKEIEIEKEELEYRKYREEKVKLERAICVEQNKSKALRKAPKRMGNSEARLCGRRAEESREKLEGHKRSLQTRLNKLEEKEKPKKQMHIYMKMNSEINIKSKYCITGENIHIQFGDKIILQKENLHLLTNAKMALLGKNGAGKTSLIHYILEEKEGIKINPDVRIGYFSQELDILDKNKTIIENVLDGSIQNENICRNVLGRLLFCNDDVYKKVEILSGGEQVKVALAKVLVSDANVLIMDEATNFLDIPSLEALEKLMKEFKGTILFTSHDRSFINSIATCLLIIRDKKLLEFCGNYTEYLRDKEQRKRNEEKKEDDLLLELRIASINSKLTLTKNKEEKEMLEKEYWELVKRKKKL